MVIRKQATAINAPCGICTQPFKYICPRCNLRYCSLTCYKDKSHIQCTESFYKSSVISELKASPGSTPQDRQKMLGILDRFEKQAVAQEGLFNSPDYATNHSMETDHSSLGEPSGMKKTLSANERIEILRKAIEEEKQEAAQGGTGSEELDDNEKAELEQMLEQEYQDLVNRFAGVDLDKESFDTLWAKLTLEEQQEFQEKFMLTGRELGSTDLDLDGSERMSEEETDQEDSKERQEAKELLKEMSETMKRGEIYSAAKKKSKVVSNDDNNPLLANLDAEDLRAIRDAEISELIPVWRPWWEVEAEEAGQLKKVSVTEVPGDQETDASKEVSSILDINCGSTPHKEPQTSTIPTSTHTVLESYVLDEEAMLRPHKSLVHDMDDVGKEEEDVSMVPMIKEPHPSLIYHVAGLIFAYAATIRVFNGDLKEEPEQVLAYIFDLCPFFAPPPSSSTGSKSKNSKAPPSTPAPTVDVQDFETTLAVIQRSSLDSKLWKGDASRLEMLALLLRDLTLILAKPSRCLFSVRELKQVFNTCMELKSSQAPGDQSQRRLFSKTVLHRLLKKLEFYESFLLSKTLIQQSDRLDRVRMEVVLSGIQVRQEMVGWTKELESVTRVKASTATEQQPSSNSSSKKVLIEEIA